PTRPRRPGRPRAPCSPTSTVRSNGLRSPPSGSPGATRPAGSPRSTPRPFPAEALGLVPHPEGGWYRQTWAAGPSYQPDGYPGSRPAATAIYFLLTPGAEAAWHTGRSDEVWLWHAGGPLTLRLGGTGTEPVADPSTVTLGPDLAAGQAPQHIIPGGDWQSARRAGDQEGLGRCVVAH